MAQHLTKAASGFVPLALLLGAMGCNRSGVANGSTSPPSAAAPRAPAAAPAVSARQTPAATLGRIACGSGSCQVTTEFCFEGTQTTPRCLAIAEEQNYARGASSDDALYLCDDASDCPAGQQCCAGSWGGTGPSYHACTADRCQDHVTCLPGSVCPAGLRCEPLPHNQARGMCVPDHPGVACGASRCQKPEPRCCWQSDTRSGRCMSASADRTACSADGESLLECRNRADCGGYFCCRELLGSTTCSSTCPGAAVAVACETFADCPPEGPGPGGILQRYDRCEAGACTGELCNPDGTWRSCSGL